ncbi:FAD binding domain-containing protein [Mangrovicoccus algicola]|uniref:FAD binding domain-containing protein n=1 Tax=Mangrovicoccus algicola TaxID=2771008 RepID=A0A8J6Z8U7_9RHOB|nr:FAD binding domain-containing protein [Mangrovicoccus algicola]MBE3640074.1 FAD binding domain-containing protein [Mangrovicoccus algicola]
MKPAPFDLVPAMTAAEALPHLAGPREAKPVAGSQSLGPMLNLRVARPELLVDLSACADLRAVTEEDDAILYGAAITHAEFEDGAVPDATPGWLAPIARRIAYRAVRNRGTIGGSIAHADPAADWVVTMTGLGASVRILGPRGARDLPMAEFVTGALSTALEPGEIIAAIRLPRRSARARWSYWKFCRKTGEFAKASACVLADPDRGEHRVLAAAIERAPVALPDPQALIEGRADPRAAVEAALPFLTPERRALQVTATIRALDALDALDALRTGASA